MADAANAPVPGTPEYDAAMVALADSRTGAPSGDTGVVGGAPAADAPAAPVKPEGVPDKFWDAEKGVVRTEELLKSYRELESQRGKPADAPAAGEKAPASDDQGSGDTDTSEAKAKAAGVDFAKLEAEYVTNGALSDQAYADLAAKGLDKETVDAYIEGKRAQAAAVQQAGYDLVGGADKYAEIIGWAKDALSADEKVAFNKAVTGKDASVRELAILGMQAKYAKANGSDPTNFLGGKQQSSGGLTPFASRAEMTAAINDPKFSSDPAYRARVEQRIGLM